MSLNLCNFASSSSRLTTVYIFHNINQKQRNYDIRKSTVKYYS
nr:MAG TPA: hypothetical protein [Caudoviricetes sp.]